MLKKQLPIIALIAGLPFLGGCRKNAAMHKKKITHLNTRTADFASNATDDLRVYAKTCDAKENRYYFGKRTLPFDVMKLTFDNQSEKNYRFDPKASQFVLADNNNIAKAIHPRAYGAYAIGIGSTAIGVGSAAICTAIILTFPSLFLIGISYPYFYISQLLTVDTLAFFCLYPIIFIAIFPIVCIAALTITCMSAIIIPSIGILSAIAYKGIHHHKNKKAITKSVDNITQPIIIPAGQKVTTFLFLEKNKNNLFNSFNISIHKYCSNESEATKVLNILMSPIIN